MSERLKCDPAHADAEASCQSRRISSGLRSSIWPPGGQEDAEQDRVTVAGHPRGDLMPRPVAGVRDRGDVVVGVSEHGPYGHRARDGMSLVDPEEQPGASGGIRLDAELASEYHRRAAEIVGEDLLAQEREPSGLRHGRTHNGGAVLHGAGVVLPV